MNKNNETKNNEDNTASETKRLLFAVMKMQESVTCTLFNGHEEDVKIVGIAGMIPLFESYEEAEKASSNGKYDIIQMQVGSK